MLDSGKVYLHLLDYTFKEIGSHFSFYYESESDFDFESDFEVFSCWACYWHWYVVPEGRQPNAGGVSRRERAKCTLVPEGRQKLQPWYRV